LINEQIRDKEVRVIGEDGEQLGIMSSREALKMAQEAELDLVKIAPTAVSIVMRLPVRKKRRRRNRKLLRSKKFVFPPISIPTI
jgi:translation initiation factor IF-3